MKIESFLNYITNIKNSINAGHGSSSAVYLIINLARHMHDSTQKIEKILTICILCHDYINNKINTNKDISIVRDIHQKAIRLIVSMVDKNTGIYEENHWGPRPTHIEETFKLEKIYRHSNYLSVMYSEWLKVKNTNLYDNEFANWFEYIWLPNEISIHGATGLLSKLNHRISYLNRKQSADYLVEISGGLLRYRNGCLVDTAKFNSIHNHKVPLGIFVLSTYVELFISSHSADFRHSSFVSGDPVFCAGEIGVEQGVIKSISRNSGHYKPDAATLYKFLNFLLIYNVDIEPIKVHYAVKLPSYFVRGSVFYKSPENFCT